MDNSLKESLDHAKKMKVFNNQLRLLKEKYLERNIHFTVGHQFTIDLKLFYDNIMDLYQQNLNAYIVEYNKLVQDKGRI